MSDDPKIRRTKINAALRALDLEPDDVLWLSIQPSSVVIRHVERMADGRVIIAGGMPATTTITYRTLEDGE